MARPTKNVKVETIDDNHYVVSPNGKTLRFPSKRKPHIFYEKGGWNYFGMIGCGAPLTLLAHAWCLSANGHEIN